MRADTVRPLLLATWLLLTGCQPGVPQAPARRESEGAVYVYLDRFTGQSQRLRVVLDGVSAVTVDGRDIPLAASLGELKGADLSRQRLLATGPLPAGAYVGFGIRTARASLRGAQGESALIVPDTVTRIDFPFDVRRGETSVVAFALKYGESVDPGFRFSPAFSAYRPDRPAVNLMGFVANSGSSDVTVYDKKTARVFDVIATGQAPQALALDQRARRLYVALSQDDAIDVVDVLAGKVSDRIRLTPGDQPVALALMPDGATLLTANRGSNTVSVVDTASRYEQGKIRVPSGPRSIVVERAGRRAFVVSDVSSSVSAIDVPSRAVIRTIPTDAGAVQAQLNRRADRLYVIHELTSWLTVINPTTLALVGRFPVRSPMEAIKVDPSADFLYLAGKREFTVGIYDPISLAAVDFVDTGTPIVHMTMDADENTSHLLSAEAARVLIVDRIRKRALGEVDVGTHPTWISLMGEN